MISTEGLVSIILMIIFGVPGLLLFFKINQTKIIYLEKRILNLKSDLVSNFEDLSIRYKGVEIDQNIYFLNSILLCNGNKDITGKRNLIEIIGHEKSRWLEFKVITKSKGLNLNYELDKNVVKLHFDLFKTDEYFEWEGILKSIDSGKKKSKLITFHHRLPNITNIEKYDLNNLKDGLISIIIGSFFLIFPILAVYGLNNIKPHELTINSAKDLKILSNPGLIDNEEINKIKQKISSEESGISLYLKGGTDPYNIEYYHYYKKDYTSRLKKIKVIFKMKKIGYPEIFPFILIVIFFFLAMFLIYIGSISMYRKKKYLKSIQI